MSPCKRLGNQFSPEDRRQDRNICRCGGIAYAPRFPCHWVQMQAELAPKPGSHTISSRLCKIKWYRSGFPHVDNTCTDQADRRPCTWKHCATHSLVPRNL